ncbi:S41 family peptidase [Bacteroidales bacterium OttesenSCG-928-I21]|nr:S41 family peptidase [Bacteroidales bacterium OttesenSCG-928-I21]
MSEYNNKKIQIFLPLVIAISIVFGVLLSFVFTKHQNINDFLSTDLPQDKLTTVINYVESQYVDTINRKELEEIAIPKFLESLDPHTTYSSAEETKEMEEELQGNFEGIGVQFNIFKDTVYVVKVIEGGPSEFSGVFAGDRIVKVNDSLIAGVGINNDKVMKLLKGPGGSKVTIDIKRKGNENLIPITIKRGNIPISSIDAHYMIDKNTGYIKISSFSLFTYQDFLNTVSTMKRKGINALVVDLRNNSGGYLSAATNMIDEFLEAGKMIVYTEGRARDRVNFLSTKERSEFVDLKIAVLVDDFSASASEIFAGAIQDNDRGTIIGRRTFGKGLVQEAKIFNDGSMIRLTTARYYTPSGRCIQKPYGKDVSDYYSEIANRFYHGEFIEKDSINFKDSIIYYTSGGRKVYGGGGIMPDIFVPIDTAGYSPLFGEINKKNLTYNFALEYVDKNRNKLLTVRNINEIQKFLNSNNAFEEFWGYISKNNVIIKSDELKISKIYIENNLSAYIARQVLDENAFYEIANKFDPSIDSAMVVFRTSSINTLKVK